MIRGRLARSSVVDGRVASRTAVWLHADKLWNTYTPVSVVQPVEFVVVCLRQVTQSLVVRFCLINSTVYIIGFEPAASTPSRHLRLKIFLRVEILAVTSRKFAYAYILFANRLPDA